MVFKTTAKQNGNMKFALNKSINQKKLFNPCSVFSYNFLWNFGFYKKKQFSLIFVLFFCRVLLYRANIAYSHRPPVPHCRCVELPMRIVPPMLPKLQWLSYRIIQMPSTRWRVMPMLPVDRIRCCVLLWNLNCTRCPWIFYIRYSNDSARFWKLLPLRRTIHSR